MITTSYIILLSVCNLYDNLAYCLRYIARKYKILTSMHFATPTFWCKETQPFSGLGLRCMRGEREANMF